MAAPDFVPDRDGVTLYAWVGLDEFGSGEVGVKRVGVKRRGEPVEYMALVRAGHPGMLASGLVLATMEAQASVYGKRLYLCEFTFSAVLVATDSPAPGDS